MSDQPTPNRRTSFLLDIAENTLTAPFWGFRRRGTEIAPALLSGGQRDTTRLNNVKIWPTGAISLAPIQTEVANIQEYAIGLQFLPIQTSGDLLSKLVTAGVLAIENSYRQNNDLPGFAASSRLVESGGPFLVKKIPAGATWDNQVQSGLPSLLGGDATDVLMDRVGESVDTYPSDQAYFLNWEVPGTNVSYPNYTLAFYFANFGVAFTGSGYAKLYELMANSQGTQEWLFVDEWRYARTGHNSNTAHSLGIWPHSSPRGDGFIAFTNGQVDYAQRVTSVGEAGGNVTAPGDHVYTVRHIPGYTRLASPGRVTAAGLFRFDIRRDLRLKLQVSLLGWPAYGFIIDDPISLPPSNPRTPVYPFAEKVVPPGMALVGTLLDNDTGAVFNPLSSQNIAAKFEFASDGTGTPILWGYGARRDPLSTYVAPGAFSGGHLRSVSITGYNGDPSQQSATLTVEDPDGDLIKLLNRGQFPVVINVTHNEGGRDFVTPIFRGYVNGPTARKQGGATAANPNWWRYTMPCLGMWMRLAEPVQSAVLQQQFYAELDAHGNPTGSPWKVTDAVRYLLLCCGFSPAQIQIPDIDFRLWFGIGTGNDELNVSPHTDFAEMAMGFVRSYLGMYLHYNEQADFWTLLTGTRLDAAPLYNFTTHPPRGASQTAAGGYPPRTTFITDLEIQTLPPEFNVVHVSTGAPTKNGNFKQAIERYFYNFNSTPIYGAGIVPDPSQPDFLGRVREVEIIDPSLVVNAGPNTAQATQLAVDWTARRIYDFCCHGQKLAHFHAPLALIIDPVTNLYRPLQFVDPITINGEGGWQIKCVQPNYGATDNQQMANYQCIQPVAGQYVPPGLTQRTFNRSAASKMQRKGIGASTSSLRLGSLAPVPQDESRHRNLPVNTDFQYPMQDAATGQFYYMSGY